MKKLFALLLITIFTGSASVKLYKDITGANPISFSILQTEEDNTEKEVEKENDLKKEKHSVSFFNVFLPNIMRIQKFYIQHLYFLPNPMIAKDIIPPNLS